MSFYIDALSKLPDGKATARHVAEYYTYDEAMAAAKHIIDSFLFREFRDHAAKGMRAEELYESFKARGERPVILRKGSTTSTNVSRFDALHYAKQRSSEICEGSPKA